jgi:hypothetical protein
VTTLLRRLGAILLTLGTLSAVTGTAQAAAGGTLGVNLSARYASGSTGPLVGALVTAENIDTALVYPVPAFGDPATSAYYQATNLPFGRYRLRIERMGFATTYWPHQYSRDTAAPVTFGTAPGCNPADAAICDLHILTGQVDQTVTVSGTVRHRSGQAQPGALVTATRTSEPTFHPSTTTDGSGAYALQVPAGSYELSTPNGNSAVRETINVNGPTSRDLTLLGVPGAPRDITVTTSGRQATVFWSRPADDGGAEITSYTVTTTPGGGTCTTPTTSCTFDGLENGRTYTFRVAGVNRVGSGTPTATDALLQGPTPSPARDVRVAPGDRSLAVAWSASASDDVRGYIATASPGGKRCSTADLACTITGLRNGRAYRVTVTARTATADSAPATAARPVSPLGPPGSPRDLRVTPTAGGLTVTWRAPLDDGGRRIQHYVATAWPGGRTCQATDTRRCTIGGLTTGTAYSVTVRASNRAGLGPMSPGSAPVEALAGTGVPAKVSGLQVRRTATAVVARWHRSSRASVYWVRLKVEGKPAGSWSVVKGTRARFAAQKGRHEVQVRAVGRTGPGPVAREAIG